MTTSEQTSPSLELSDEEPDPLGLEFSKAYDIANIGMRDLWNWLEDAQLRRDKEAMDNICEYICDAYDFMKERRDAFMTKYWQALSLEQLSMLETIDHEMGVCIKLHNRIKL